jgi:probable rRNA maturation factor
MQELNHTYRGKNQPTDILSFVYNEQIQDQMLVGEIIICTDQAKVDSEELSITLEHEYMWLFSHGLLHLLGYDHETEQELAIMRNLETKCMEYIQKKLIERGDY